MLHPTRQGGVKESASPFGEMPATLVTRWTLWRGFQDCRRIQWDEKKGFPFSERIGYSVHRPLNPKPPKVTASHPRRSQWAGLSPNSFGRSLSHLVSPIWLAHWPILGSLLGLIYVTSPNTINRCLKVHFKGYLFWILWL